MTNFFDEDDLYNEVRDEYNTQCESMADDAESMRDRMYDTNGPTATIGA